MKLARRLCVALVAVVVGAAGAQTVKVGEASYLLAPKSGEKTPPDAPHRTDAMRKTAAQTNQWYSTLIFDATPEVLFAQPLTVKIARTGVEVALPGKEVVPTVRRDVEIHYPHRDPLVFSPVAFAVGPHQLAKASDWSIDVAMATGNDSMVATVSHGSPYVFFKLSRGDIRVQVPASTTRVDSPADARVLALDVKGKRYAVFGPQGVQWEAQGADAWVGRLPAGKGYFSTAALPDGKPETLAHFTRHAYAFIQDTRVAWRYDQARSQVETTFKATTQVMEGTDNVTLLGLYPHHWFRNAHVADRLGAGFDTLRGQIRTLAANEFKTVQPYVGWVPFWPAVQAQPGAPDLADVMSKDVRDARRMLRQGGNGPYWQGKGLMRVIKLMDVVEQQGDLKERDRLLALVKDRIEDWFSGQDSKTYFQYDEKLGTMVAHPEEYFSIEQMNDHHFHYGYWIRAVAEIALRDPAWAAKDRWGGMVDKLIADIANTQRGDKAFPFLRNFDPYEGHSWASGIGLGEFGNNQESSSEAVNAWAGLILWGEVTGDRAVRDLGIYLYTSEVQAIDHYWFDVHRLVFPPEYKNVETSMVFGGKYAHNTWWTDEPRQIKGINLLPINTGSIYLGRYPEYVQKNLDALIPEMATYKQFGKLPPNPPPADIWQDIFAKYQALADPQKALKAWDRWGSVELGETRTSTLHWMLSLQALGLPDPSKWAYDTERNQAGWYNNELQYYAANRLENARVEGGHLIITARRERLTGAPDFGGQNYTSARLITRGLASWTYGHVVVRARLPCGRGTWPAIWMLGTGGTWPDDGEIDIMEQTGQNKAEVLGTVHTRAYNYFNGSLGVAPSARQPLPDACTAFNDYHLTWTAERIRIGVNGTDYFQYDNPNNGDTTRWPFNRPQYLLLNLAVGGDLGGAVDDSALPQQLVVDHVRVYQP